MVFVFNLSDYYGGQIKEYGMDGTCSMHESWETVTEF
jgi:hypothetical protein